LRFVKLFSAVCLAGSVCLISLLALLLTRGNASFPAVFPYVALLGGAVGGLLYLGVDALLTFGRAEASSSLILVRDRSGRVVSLKSGGGAAVRRRVEEGGFKPERFRSIEVLKALKIAVSIAALLEGYLVLALLFGTLTPVMVVPSTSMSPTLNVGDLIVVRGVDVTTIKPGDIIVFNVPQPYDRYTPSPIVHRVVDVRFENGKPFFTTKGDNIPSPDGWLVPAENVIGVCVWRIPYLGYPALFLRTPYGIATAAVIIMLIIFIPQRKKNIREVEY